MTSARSLPGRWLVTGLRGTVAPKVAAELVARGGEPVAWDRDAIPVDDVAAGTAFLSADRWAGVLHVGMGPEEWAGRLAGFAAARRIPFAFTSTVSVFGDEPDRPHHPGDERTARDDYGRYKARCEDAVAAAYPAAIIARIGWQIHPDGQGNNMLAQLDRQAAEGGRVIRASRRWRPATSWMTDTATALLDAVTVGRSGVLHLDSNAVDAWSFADVVRHVAAIAGRDWQVEETDDVVQDQQLVGHGNLTPRLPARAANPAPAAAAGR